jgi:hypothetical protein
LFGHAFLRAIAALAGCWFSIPEPDQYKLDITVGTHLDDAGELDNPDPVIAIQAKTATQVSSESQTHFRYSIDRGTHDYLRSKAVGFPRLLVVVRLPHHPTYPMVQSAAETHLLNAPFWVNIKGHEPIPNGQDSMVIDIDKSQVLTPASLRDLLLRTSKGAI